ncbi:MAG: SH3 domain-containing protein [Chloroflexota bacterium]
MAKRKNIPVVHQPGGYEAYRDQMPIRTPNWRAIMFLVGFIFICGVITTISLVFIPRLFFKQAPTATPTGLASIVQDVGTVDPAFDVIVSTPQATLTPTPTDLPTAKSTSADPTVDYMMVTVAFMADRLSAIQTQTAMPVVTELVVTATPSLTPLPQYDSMARVVYNNVIVRAGSTTNSTALTMVYNGETFGVLETVTGWVRVDHPDHNTAWIARHLLRIDDE